MRVLVLEHSAELAVAWRAGEEVPLAGFQDIVPLSLCLTHVQAVCALKDFLLSDFPSGFGKTKQTLPYLDSLIAEEGRGGFKGCKMKSGWVDLAAGDCYGRLLLCFGLLRQ